MVSYSLLSMSDDEARDYIRRERIMDTLLEFERRIRERMLSIDSSECWDLLLNRAPAAAGANSSPSADPLPLRYETRDRVSLLRVVKPDGENRACLDCDLFGRSHCCGGLIFLYYALRETGVERPLDWLAVELEPGLYLPDWELMLQNSRRIARRLREYFEAHFDRVNGHMGDVFP